MNNNMSAAQLVDVYNFLVTQAEGAIARAVFVWKAAGLRPMDLQKKKVGAIRSELAFSGLEEANETYGQIVGLYKEANRAWGRCLTVRRKALSALRKELVEAAEAGAIQRVVELSLLLAKLVNDTTAEEAAVVRTEVEVVWGDDNPPSTRIEEFDDDLPF